MEPELRHGFSMLRDQPVGVKGAEAMEEVARLVESGLGRRIEPGERRGIVRTPLSKLQGQRGEVRLSDFGRRMRL